MAEVKHLDLLGHVLSIGDYVAYASYTGQCVRMKVGRIVSLKQYVAWAGRDPVPRIGVVTAEHWGSYGWNLQKNGREVTMGTDHVVRLPGLPPGEPKDSIDAACAARGK